tara:strand:+ start:99 stop:782 length:684 start_codon:yes stop_codon:yes gene_type:complete
MKSNIIYFDKFFHKNVFDLLTKILNQNSAVLISGGSSIKNIVKISKKKVFINKTRTIILSDERFYNSINDLRTNYSNLKKNFFHSYKFSKLNFIYFNLTQKDKILAQEFNKNIRNRIPKVAVLSLGEDGHICSIFKGAENQRISQYVDIVKPKNKIKRVTLSKNFLKKIKKIYLIVYGSKKGTELKKIILGKETMFPLIDSNKISFILDKYAYREIENISKIKCLNQ